MHIVEGQFVHVWPDEAQSRQCAMDIQYFVGCPNLQKFWPDVWEEEGKV